MIAKTTPRITERRLATGIRRARHRRVRRQRSGPGSCSERVRLITFMWSGRSGQQPVIFADRSWLR